MNINYKQSQFELFPGSPGSSTDTGRPRYLFANLTLSIENMVIAGIFALMTMVFAFSLGVEKGKKIDGSADRFRSSFTRSSALISKSTVSQSHPKEVPTQKSSIQPILLPKVTSETQFLPKVEMTSPQINSLKESITSNRIDTTVEGKVAAKASAQEAAVNLAKPFTVQIASYKGANSSYAQKEADSLKQKGFDAFMIIKGEYTLVCVGKFSQKDDANKTIGTLKKKYNDCLIRRL